GGRSCKSRHGPCRLYQPIFRATSPTTAAGEDWWHDVHEAYAQPCADTQRYVSRAVPDCPGGSAAGCWTWPHSNASVFISADCWTWPPPNASAFISAGFWTWPPSNASAFISAGSWT